MEHAGGELKREFSESNMLILWATGPFMWPMESSVGYGSLRSLRELEYFFGCSCMGRFLQTWKECGGDSRVIPTAIVAYMRWKI